MSFISFAWTSAALLCDAKTVTRRAWNTAYARQFHDGDEVNAYNRSPRNGGKLIAFIRLAGTPYTENTLIMPDSDYKAEGYEWLRDHRQCWPRTIHGHKLEPDEFDWAGGWKRWKDAQQILYVVRFEVVRKLATIDCEQVGRYDV
jgi:hypothetical protein